MNHYQEYDHKEVSDKIKSIQKIRWIVSYDNVPEINSLYLGISKKEYSFKHTVYNSRDGQEVLFFSHNINQPQIENWNPLKFKIKIDQEGAKTLIYKN